MPSTPDDLGFLLPGGDSAGGSGGGAGAGEVSAAGASGGGGGGGGGGAAAVAGASADPDVAAAAAAAGPAAGPGEDASAPGPTGRKRAAPEETAGNAADDKKARERKRILRNRELARVSNERRKQRIKQMEGELQTTRQTVASLEESIRSLEAENGELKTLLENKS